MERATSPSFLTCVLLALADWKTPFFPFCAFFLKKEKKKKKLNVTSFLSSWASYALWCFVSGNAWHGVLSIDRTPHWGPIHKLWKSTYLLLRLPFGDKENNALEMFFKCSDWKERKTKDISRKWAALAALHPEYQSYWTLQQIELGCSFILNHLHLF